MVDQMRTGKQIAKYLNFQTWLVVRQGLKSEEEK
jgi:hypothetical protein